MSDKIKVIAEKIHLQEFKIIKGQIDSPEDFIADTVDGHAVELSFEMAFSLDEHLVKCDFAVEISSNSKNAAEAKGLFHFVYIFYVENLKELTRTENDEINVNGGLANALASITHSTSRGVLLTRFQGTSLQNFMLPIINPNELVAQVLKKRNKKSE